MIQISIGWSGKFKSLETDVIKGFIVNTEKEIFDFFPRYSDIYFTHQKLSSVHSTNWWTDKVALYGSTTVSETLGDGTTEKVFKILNKSTSTQIRKMAYLWQPLALRSTFKLPELVPLIAVQDVDEMILQHNACPYRRPRTPGYSPYLVPELVFGHYFGPLTRSMAASHFERFKSPFEWQEKYSFRNLVDWDFPTEPEQFAYLYNHSRAPFVSLTLLSILELGPCYAHHTVRDALSRAVRMVHKETNPLHWKGEQGNRLVNPAWLNVQWTFSHARAPHTNGVTESLIKSAKRTIRKILNRDTYDESMLRTAFLYAEDVLNSRPIAVVNHHPADPIWSNQLLPVRIFFFDFGYKQSSQSWSSATTQWVR